MKKRKSMFGALIICAAAVQFTPAEAGAQLDGLGIKNVRIFDTAVSAAGLRPVVDADRSFTLFLPADEALEAEGAAVLLSGVYLTPSNRERLFDLVAYHLVPGEKIDLASAPRDVTTLSGEALSIARDGGRILLNGHVGVTRSIDFGKGVVHIVSGLLWAELNPRDGHGDVAQGVTW
ncbi:MAG: fasciclin domain-containing protein [Kiloniellales bacterium]|nr:fasciclin domain-containing protein [Kiloniellales bacterium]